MKLSEFDYSLPENKIAQSPIYPRDKSKLLILNSSTWDIQDNLFYQIENYLTENDVLVLNTTKVINARLFWKMDIYPRKSHKIKDIQILLHRQINWNTWECMGFPGNNLKLWRIIKFYDMKWSNVLNWKIIDFADMGRIIEFDKSGADFFEAIDKVWELPLPPYIKNKDFSSDDYQTIYANEKWSAAAPTAGLHFTSSLLEKLKKKWVKIENLLLHVWVWTFRSVETENIKDHNMHSEFAQIDKATADRLNEYKKNNKRIIAVWTTSVRTLESFADDKWFLSHWSQNTDIFIYPWYKWKFVDSLITNFHLPKSTLLMLVSSFAWLDNIKKSYEFAKENDYRFFSFGDAMWII